MMHFKSLGTKWYQAGEYVKASKRYEEATKFALSETALDRMKEENAESITSDERKAKLAQGNQALASCYLNLARCHIKLGDPKAAVAACSEAVKKDQKNLKARFRRGQARLAINDLDGARKDLYEAAKLDPQNKEVRKEIEALKRAEQQLKEKQKGMFGGMFK